MDTETASTVDSIRSSYEDDIATIKKVQHDIDQTMRILEKLQRKLSADMGHPSQNVLKANRSALLLWYNTKKRKLHQKV